MSPYKYSPVLCLTFVICLICCQVSSSNVDRNRVALHSILYTVSTSELSVGKTTTSSKILRCIYFRNITAAPIRVGLCPEVSGTIAIHVPRQFAQTAAPDDSTPTGDPVPAENLKLSEKTSSNRPFGSISNMFVGNGPRKSASKHGPASSKNDEVQLARLQSQLDLATPPSRMGREKKDLANPQIFQDSPIKRPVRRRTSTIALVDRPAKNDLGVPPGSMPEEKLLVSSQSQTDGVQNSTSSSHELERLLSIYDTVHQSIDPPFFKSCEQERGFVLDKQELLRKCETLLAESCVQVNDIILYPEVDVPVILGISAENWYAFVLKVSHRRLKR
jgi:hypothetical protein